MIAIYNFSSMNLEIELWCGLSYAIMSEYSDKNQVLTVIA